MRLRLQQEQGQGLVRELHRNHFRRFPVSLRLRHRWPLELSSRGKHFHIRPSTVLVGKSYLVQEQEQEQGQGLELELGLGLELGQLERAVVILLVELLRRLLRHSHLQHLPLHPRLLLPLFLHRHLSFLTKFQREPCLKLLVHLVPEQSVLQGLGCRWVS